jgi:RNA polymerase sigma-70 factor, ECF subfamily
MSEMLLLVEPQIPALRRYARALTRDRSLADDLVQDCLERAVSRWHQRRQEGNPRAWLFSILHNLAMAQLGKMRPGQQLAVEDADESAMARPAQQPDRIQHRDLLRALAQLNEAQRSVLLLVGVEDLSYAEAARVLDVPIGTVMSRLSRAREKLAQIMEGEVIDTPVATPAGQPILRRIK